MRTARNLKRSRLVEDLADYLTGAVHAPLLQAALVHAEFETIHPFADGNGRFGRALIHTVLTRHGLTRAAVLPVSLVLLTRSQEYVEGLTAYLRTMTERRLASTRWDTRESAPRRATPARPQIG